MEYKEYLDNARKLSGINPLPDITEFYWKGIHNIDNNLLTDNYKLNVKLLAEKVRTTFDNVSAGGLSIQYRDDIFELFEIGAIANEIVPILEKDLYGCNLYIDKAYIWRSLSGMQRDTSWLWHYDNNPNEIYKIMIYLTDVSEDCAPFEYIQNSSGLGLMKLGTRQGTKNWKPAPDGGRVSANELDYYFKRGAKQVKVTGNRGTIFVFNNNVIHRANPASRGKYRDVLVIRIKPTEYPVKNYFDRIHTTSFECSGIVNINPEILDVSS